MKKLILACVVALALSTVAMAGDIAISTQAGWFGQAAADREMQEIADNVTAVPVEQFTADDQAALADWVVAHTGNGVADLLILCGQLPATIYAAGNAEPDGSLAELFLDDGNIIVNTGDYMFYVCSAGNNDTGGLENMMDIPGISMWDDNTPVVVTADGLAITPSLADFETDRPFHLDQLTGAWFAELVLAQNDAGTRADAVIVASAETGGRLGIFYQTASQDDDPRGEVISEWINNWYLTAGPVVNPGFPALSPNPADGAVDVTSPLFEWTAGYGAVSHDVYFGMNPEPDANEFIVQQAFTMYFHQGVLEPGATYYWRIDEVDADGNVTTGNVWSFTVQPVKSYDHMPWDGAKFQSVETDLSWKAGQGAVSHDVYFGTDEALVEAGDPNASVGNQVDTSFDPGTLELETTYYWRVDEVGATGDVVAGDVLSFSTTLPGLGLVKREIWEGIGGVDVNDLLGDPNYPKNPTFVDEMPDFKSPPFDPDKNDYGGRLSAWLHVPAAGDYTFWVAGDDNCRLFLGPDLDGAVQIAEVPGWTGVDDWDKYPEQKSDPIALEEGVYYLEALWKEAGGGDSCSAAWQGAGVPTRSLITGGYCEPFIKLMASHPVPAKGAVDVPQWLTVSWWEGVSAAEHDLYGGTDEEAVRNADPTTPGIYLGRVSETSADLSDLPWGTTFFWRIDEVNDADVWPGPVWNFTTAADHIPVVQSPLTVDYDNTVEPYITEAAKMLDVAQDWTTRGMDSLLLQITGSQFKVMQTADGVKMRAAGADIYQTTDEFRFLYKTLTGDGSITAVVESVENTHEWAKGGVMIRASLEPVDVMTHMIATPTNRVEAMERPVAGEGTNGYATDVDSTPLPHWVRITRVGNTFTGEHSADGENWEIIVSGDNDSVFELEMPEEVYIGLAATSHVAGTLGLSEFSNIAMTGAVSGDWQVIDMGVAQGGNDPAPLYVAVEDTAGNVATVDHPANPDAVMNTDTTPWKVQLDELGGVDLKSIAGIYVGVGDGAPDGTGTVTLEDARVVDGFSISLDNANPTPHATVWQLTDHVITAGETFKLSLRVRVSKGVIRDRNSIKATLYYDDNGKRVPLASKSWWAADGKQVRTVSVDTDGKPEAGGKRLGVEFTNLMENWLQIDKVSVTGK